MATLISDHKHYLRVQFYWQGKRYRESLGLRDNRENRREWAHRLRALEVALRQPGFDLAKWFPGSRRLSKQSVTDSSPAVTLGAYARRWLAGQELTRATRRDYEYLFRTFLDATPLGAMEPSAVSKHDIRAAAAGKSIRRSTMALQRLRAIFDEAIEDGLCDRNPAKAVKNPRVASREPVEGFSGSEMGAVIDAAAGQDLAFILVARHTGLRPSEILSIQRKDVDVRRRRLVVRGTKTAGSARVIDLSAAALNALRMQLADLRVSPTLFRFNYVNWRSRNWARIIAAAAIPYRSPYALRHTYAIAALEAGYDPVYAARQLGHTSTEMVHRYYGRWTLRVAAAK